MTTQKAAIDGASEIRKLKGTGKYNTACVRKEPNGILCKWRVNCGTKKITVHLVENIATKSGNVVISTVNIK